MIAKAGFWGRCPKLQAPTSDKSRPFFFQPTKLQAVTSTDQRLALLLLTALASKCVAPTIRRFNQACRAKTNIAMNMKRLTKLTLLTTLGVSLAAISALADDPTEVPPLPPVPRDVTPAPVPPPTDVIP